MRYTRPIPNLSASFNSLDSGKLLAQKYCQGCHLLPDPSLLDKKTWVNSVLPNMALRLGIRTVGTDPYADLPEVEIKAIRPLGIYPETAVLSESDWQLLVSYFEKEAPDVLPPPKKAIAVTNQLPLFKVQTMTLGDEAVPKTTLLKYDASRAQLYVGDDHHALFVLDGLFNLSNKWWIDTAPTDIDFPKNTAPRLLTIGKFNPSDQKLGRLLSVEKNRLSFGFLLPFPGRTDSTFLKRHSGIPTVADSYE